MNAGVHHLEEQVRYMKESRSNTDDLKTCSNSIKEVESESKEKQPECFEGTRESRQMMMCGESKIK